MATATASTYAPAPVPTDEVCALENYLLQPDHAMDARIARAKHALGASTVILGHHYQRDEVFRFADHTGDSYRLSKIASETGARNIVFCGVHFMAESACVLGRPDQTVILPDLNAGCSMADMAEIGQVEEAWEQLVRLGIARDDAADDAARGITPITYMNSTAAIKAFCGERGGLVCTSSNAAGAFRWAFDRTPKVFFLPDQHLGRNTAYAMRPDPVPLDQMAVWDPFQLLGGNTPERLRAARIILWKGHCSVHQRFLPQHVDAARAKYPGIQVVVHPECRWEVCQKADAIGSTDQLRKLIAAAPAGAQFAVGTEIHLVNRMAAEHPDKRVLTLDDSGCLCTTMFRISPQHLCWALENLVEGKVVNRITVDDATRKWAKVALDRMLEIQ